MYSRKLQFVVYGHIAYLSYMKHLVFFVILMLSSSIFSQTKSEETSELPLFLSFVKTDKSFQYESSALTNLGRFNYSFDHLEMIRQGQCYLSLKNLKSNFNKISPMPSLNIELNRIMFTGNNFNPEITRFNFKN